MSPEFFKAAPSCALSEEDPHGIEPRTKLLQLSTGYTVPNCYAKGYRYARLLHARAKYTIKRGEVVVKGGEIAIKGRAGDWLGREMLGGKIAVLGEAGDRVGSGYRSETCGMRGGEIPIEGLAGDYLGEHLFGGTITVFGSAGDVPRIANKGGVIAIGGGAHLPGAEMTRGTIAVKGKAWVLPSYQYQETGEIEGLTHKKFVGDLVNIMEKVSCTPHQSRRRGVTVSLISEYLPRSVLRPGSF